MKVMLGLKRFSLMLLIVVLVTLINPLASYAKGNAGEAGTVGEVEFYIEDTKSSDKNELPNTQGQAKLPQLEKALSLPQTSSRHEIGLIIYGAILIVLATVLICKTRGSKYD